MRKRTKLGNNNWSSACASVMEAMFAEPVQNVDNEGGQAMADCLNTSVVVRKIFQHLSSTELLQLSLVNKLWSYEARTEIRQRGNVIANVRPIHGDVEPCEEYVEAFLSVARKMTIVPFTGILVGSTYGHKCPDREVDSNYDEVIDKLQLKKVSVLVFGNWSMMKMRDCPELLLVEKVLQGCSSVLEELSLSIDCKRKQFVEQIIGECRFPRLKFLKLRERYSASDKAHANYMKELVSRAPRLEVLQTEGPIDTMLKVLEGSSAVILYQHQVCAPFDKILETAIGKLRLEKMRLVYTGPEFNFKRFNRMTPKLLQESCTNTLHSLDVDAVLAGPLMCYRVCLKNVKDLNIHMNYLEPWILAILKDFEFSQIFPNLKKVRIRSGRTQEVSPDHRSRIIELARGVIMPHRASNVKELRFDSWNFTDVSAQYFSEMFPSIDKLFVAAQVEHIPFDSIWKNWVDLKELEVRGNLVLTNGILDSVFCGLFPEEVAELRLKDKEYLKRVNIVPVMPGITCLRQLKTLTLNHDDLHFDACSDDDGDDDDDYYDDDDDDDDASFIFSKVTALIAFARCPTLAVNLKTAPYASSPEIAHLKPYVTEVMYEVFDVYDN